MHKLKEDQVQLTAEQIQRFGKEVAEYQLSLFLDLSIIESEVEMWMSDDYPDLDRDNDVWLKEEVRKVARGILDSLNGVEDYYTSYDAMYYHELYVRINDEQNEMIIDYLMDIIEANGLNVDINDDTVYEALEVAYPIIAAGWGMPSGTEFPHTYPEDKLELRELTSFEEAKRVQPVIRRRENPNDYSGFGDLAHALEAVGYYVKPNSGMFLDWDVPFNEEFIRDDDYIQRCVISKTYPEDKNCFRWEVSVNGSKVEYEIPGVTNYFEACRIIDSGDHDDALLLRLAEHNFDPDRDLPSMANGGEVDMFR